jgi:DNA processing protein
MERALRERSRPRVLSPESSSSPVLGAGIDAYLEDARGRRRTLAHAIRAGGALVSEFPPNAPPGKWTFAQRNSTIAALGELTVVVEAPVGSGALITAAEARRLGRPVYAVPGPIGAAASAGANALLASGGAKLLTATPMVLEVLGVSTRPRAGEVDGLDAGILDALASSPAGLDALARSIGVDPAALSSRLARLVIRGVVAAAPDGRFVRR